MESKLGEKLNGLTSERVFTIVMAVLISVPIFDSTTYTYFECPTSMTYGINRV